MKKEIALKRETWKHLLVPLVAAVAVATTTDSRGAVTDLASGPMASAASTVVKPNIMFILDDSGSMGWSYLPDAAGNLASKWGYKSSQCNGVYYNPNITYTPPVDATGTPYASASFTAAKDDGFNAGSSNVNLSTSFKAYGSDTAQAAYYYKYGSTELAMAYTYDASGNAITTTQFYKDCNTDSGSTAAQKAKWTKVTVSSTSGPGGTDERTNFANWYSYYRLRIMMMKSAAGKAFKTIGDNYRVGFTTINYTGTDNSNAEFLNISDFNATQKSSWYSKMYAIVPNNSTPLRTALSKVGRIYAGKIGTDPVQYSCQQNFTIMTTDGYWNEADPGGYQVNGTTGIGNQDNDLTASPRPFFDGGATTNASNTLADVAMYYYKTDLRSSTLGTATSNAPGFVGNDVSENNVPTTAKDTATYQHMTTFTLGLGVDGTLKYAENYESGGSADYTAILQGTKNWPKPVSNEQTTVDDLWHAAVNGRGTYFSAKNPDSLASGLSKALSGVSAMVGSAAAAATSNLEPVAGDNFAYVAMYQTQKWDGDLQARTIDLTTGAVSATPVWSAKILLDAKAGLTSDTRTIYTFANTAPNKLKTFIPTNLTAEKTAGYFNTAGLSQYASWSTAQQTAATPDTLINFLRGQAGNEDQAGNADRLYRDREHVLGDIVDSKPIYVKLPQFNYTDTGYSSYKSSAAITSRPGVVYAGSNDGMLHAFDASTGQELWAFIPSPVIPNLYRLADANYANLHQYYVDGAPIAGDVYIGGQWRTLLVGGLNKGGRGYYALDVTDPANPKALWEFTVANDNDLGYSFGNPIITKRANGTWVVLVTSGYNNVSPGDGKGYLYVLDAATGAILEKIGTGSGSSASPSGLGKINIWIDDATTDNTGLRAYGGDLNGDLWRIDYDNTTPPSGKEALLLAHLGNGGGANTQSITTIPELGDVMDNGGIHHAVVYVGTGRYLGTTDLANTDKQSFYAIKDDLSATGLGTVRTGGALVQQTLTTFTGTGGQQYRTTTTINPVDWAAKYGWFVDFNPNNETPGERINVDFKLVLGQLVVATNIPSTNACNVGGYSWLYFFDYRTGGYLSTATAGAVGQKAGNALIVGLNVIKLPNGKLITITTKSDNTYDTGNNPTPAPLTPGNRVSWRELID